MVKSLAEFIDIATGQLILNAGELQKQLSIDLLQQFARDTPVDTGRATANWKANPNTPDLTPITDKDPSVTALKTKRAAEKKIEHLRGVNNDIYITNAVQGVEEVGKKLKSGKRSKKSFDQNTTGEGYIIQLEHGKSKQAPNGMFLKNVAKAGDIVKKSKKTIIRKSRASSK